MKIRRLWANILIVLIYAASQLSSLIPLLIYQNDGLTPNELYAKTIPFLVGGFIIAAILVYFVNRSIINETALERSPKERWRYTIIWMVAGLFLALFAQMIMNMINVYIFNQPVESQNTTNILDIARKFPVFIVLISVVGPILEEFVFRKVIFGELYELIKLPRAAAFIVAGAISGLIFSTAHNDVDHTLIYMGMAFVFAGLYVATRRIIVPIVAHMTMNTFVVLMQLVFSDQIEQAAQKAKLSTQFIWLSVKHWL
ncbi:CPBP family intramembrane metalloprotease [Macrococcus equipercicus]|uniref:CPBP family intramembrane metalloprotease n=1 Tax=Macrococcus equipercicus TaxID=69967 RepID=A0ABQ6R6D5_9STAP|nr:type II CAAX endopeptidase family protein [Macrococcus equipercicus]KAA1036577.1 CPBP family intramembrane metalloprotease [Macrococcus equipercicus]